MRRYYFDYAAGTPLDPRVEKAMRPYWSEKYGNPGALHWFGQEASAAVFKARDAIAKVLGCHYREIIFTSSATEANNLALRGVLKSIKYQVSSIKRPKIIVSAIEHDSVLETARDLERDGVEVSYLPVSKEGIVDLKKLKDALDERTILVSVMYVNNEVGTIQPIKEISKLIQQFKEKKFFSPKPPQPLGMVPRKARASGEDLASPALAGRSGLREESFFSPYPLFHTDAVQAFNYLNCNVNDLGADLLTLSAQKIYGPKGAGALYARNQQPTTNNKQQITKILLPIITGGSQQEYGLRGGTENVPAIVGFGKAAELAAHSRASENKRLRELQKYFLAKIKKISKKIELNGPAIGGQRNPNNLNFYFKGHEAQDLLIKLDLAGFAVSPGAACTARTCQPSHVLKALGFSDERAMGSLRFTFGRPTTKTEIDKLLKAIYNIANAP